AHARTAAVPDMPACFATPAADSLKREWTALETLASTIAPRAMRPFREGTRQEVRVRATFRGAERCAMRGHANKGGELLFRIAQRLLTCRTGGAPAVPVASETRAAPPRLLIWVSRRSRS